MADYAIFDGKILKQDEVSISPDNRSFRYGDGFFETMKMIDGKIILGDYHFERLFASLEWMQFEISNHFTKDKLTSEIIKLGEKNEHSKLARIRLTIFRGDGGLYDDISNTPHYLIQTWKLNETSNRLNENGLVLDVYEDARKSCDKFSNLKSNNYLPYVMAALWAKKNHLNDALVLNTYGKIADATIANVFIVKNGIIKTTALSEGCVNGVMRRYLLECLREENIAVEETEIEIADVLQASEVFLTNVVFGIRWVKQVGENKYGNEVSKKFFQKYVRRLF
ncbi:MAG: aminotransferase class IV [Parafilimonas sp.]